MSTVNVGGTEFSAPESIVNGLRSQSKKDLVRQVAQMRPEGGVAFWRAFPKETLVIVVAAQQEKEPRGPMQNRHDPDVMAKAKAAGKPVPAGPSQPVSKPAADKPVGFRLKVNGGWLRRDQPRKIGDVASYKVVTDVAKAFVVKSRQQAVNKLVEARSLTGGQVEIEEIR
ncbi:hypothetical protein LCGC14_1792430, partial [marine sediment metagenome]